MSDERPDRLEAYAAGLRDHLQRADEASLKKAYDLGRDALADDVGILEMAALHHEAMAQVVGREGSTARSEQVLAAEAFFVESLSPFEMTHRAFRESNAALHMLNERLEEEAKRIAHALHTEASQLLVSAYLALDSVSRQLDPELRPKLATFGSLLDQTSEQLRRLSHELRPTILADLGLLQALRFLAEGVSARSGVPVTVQGELASRPAPVVETAIYRAVQEALNNMAKHARATEAVVRVRDDQGNVVCRVHDNGRGFDAAACGGNGSGGIGLLSIRERLEALHGKLQVNSAPGRGSELIITVPTEG